MNSSVVIVLADYIDYALLLHPIYALNYFQPLINMGRRTIDCFFVLTFVYLNLLCDSTGEKLFVVLLTLYKSAEYISEIP